MKFAWDHFDSNSYIYVMKKTIACLFIILFLVCFSFGQTQITKIDSALIPKPGLYYQPEYSFDLPVNTNAWQKEKKGLHVAFGSTDKAYFRAEVPDLKNETQSCEQTGWRGERLNAMILVWSPDTINQVRFTLNDLKDTKGNVL